MDKLNYEVDTWKVIESYLKENNYNNLIRHHLDSFNEFTDIKIEQIVKQTNPLLIFNTYDEEKNNYKYEINISKIYINLIFIYIFFFIICIKN